MRDWFSRKTPLQLALDRGVGPGGDLAAELRKLGKFTIHSEADAHAICEALAVIAEQDAPDVSDGPFRKLLGLFQDVDGKDCPAFAVFAGRGTELIVSIVSRALDRPPVDHVDHLLFALKILALYGSREGAEIILRAARLPLKADGYMWSVILGALKLRHPQREWLFSELSDPLPEKFMAVSLLDSANRAHLEGATDRHPFDSPEGLQRLKAWLSDTDEERFSYAVSATAALPFLRNVNSNELFSLGFDHPSENVQLEAAWAAAKLGREAGIRWLARSCLNTNLAARAKRYLAELGASDSIPPEANDGDFRAKATFAEWLAHPNELGCPPDEVEIIDKRVLHWPPKREAKPFWLIRYRVKDKTGLKEDDIGVGLVGSTTFCLFSYKLDERPPEDSYAIHCYWEMTNARLINVLEVPEGSSEYDHFLPEPASQSDERGRILTVAEMSPELAYPQTLVALAKISRGGEPGWLVVDGPRSRWYAEADMPPQARPKTVLMVHVGRVLLGFNGEPDRRSYFKIPVARDLSQTLKIYEALMLECRTDSALANKYLGSRGILASSFPDYVSALVAASGQSSAECTRIAYEGLLSAAVQAEPSFSGDLFDSFSAVGQNFDAYIEALVSLGRLDEIPPLVGKLRPCWDHNLGYGKLGSAAFRAGDDLLAESLLLKLRQSSKNWCRSHRMNQLAEIWCKQGQRERANELLVEAMRLLLLQNRTASGSDQSLFEEWFQDRRSAYLRLLPEFGAAELLRLQIPSTTIQQEL